METAHRASRNFYSWSNERHHHFGVPGANQRHADAPRIFKRPADELFRARLAIACPAGANPWRSGAFCAGNIATAGICSDRARAPAPRADYSATGRGPRHRQARIALQPNSRPDAGVALLVRDAQWDERGWRRNLSDSPAFSKGKAWPAGILGCA